MARYPKNEPTSRRHLPSAGFVYVYKYRGVDLVVSSLLFCCFPTENIL